MFTSVIDVIPPYSFERLLKRLETHPDDQLRVEPVSRTLKRAFRIDGRPQVVTLRFVGGVEQPRIEVQTEASPTPAGQSELLNTIRHMFSADVDLAPLYTWMGEDEKLRPLADRFRGLRFLLDADLFQAMVRTIIGQQVNLAFAAALTRRLLHLCGESVMDRDGHRYYVFPKAEAIAALQVEQLRALQYSQRKAEYIIDFARAVVDEKIKLDRLQQMPDEDVINELTKLRGVGRWTVECLLMFGMGRPDLLPAADIGLRNGIQLVYGLPKRPDEQETRRIGESWRPWRSYVSLYVWEAVGAAKRKE
ncbi:MAG: DNA-3-methyladenine glycosylase 2 family protein [Brevibacillus sp.]|nr:DNA-3-methyladenine glycosylase 2 family protein [Brevibacillus sp.]